MENPNIVRNGGIKLPIGYRFRPTDEELLVHYLTRKAHSLPFPSQVIPDLNVYQTNPTHLPGDSTEKRFFFWKRKGKWRKGKEGMAESGYWKPMGKEKHVVSFESNRAIGVKKSFVFYQGKQQQRHPRGRGGFRTQWVMREYRLLGSLQTNSMDQDWVVCKIYQKKKRSSNKKNAAVLRTDLISNTKNIWNGREITSPPTVLVESNDDDDDDKGPPQPSSSCSSGVSFCLEAARGDQEEITSAYISSSSFFGYKNY